MHVKAGDPERAMRDAVAAWAADIDAAARDRASQAARGSAEAAVARLEAQADELRGRLRRLALERVADAGADGILSDDAWAEAALALRAEHTRVLADLEGQGFSKQGLLQQLTSSAGEGFTQAQVEYAVNQTMK